MEKIRPVSYTHLDVYKRQLPHCHMDGVAGLLSDLGPDVLPHPQDVAGGAHPHQACLLYTSKAAAVLHTAVHAGWEMQDMVDGPAGDA